MMKRHAALAAALCSALGSPTSWGAEMTISPAEPRAFQPFEISAIVSYGLPTTPVTLQAVDGVITLEYASTTVDFIPPAGEINAMVAGLKEGSYTVKILHRTGTDVTDTMIQQTLTIGSGPTTQDVYAFYNEGTRHYFVTASAAERGSVMQGGAGDSWIVSDAGFKAWPATGPAPEGAVSVCRFYSATVNSHFYTADTTECEDLKQADSGWAYEGIAFRALVPARGSCPGGTNAVWRLYNDRAAQLDSNHRFVASSETYRSMMADGWVGEGIAFCSPK